MSFKALSQYPKLQATDDSDLGSNASLSASQSSLSGRSIPMSWAYMELIQRLAESASAFCICAFFLSTDFAPRHVGILSGYPGRVPYGVFRRRHGMAALRSSEVELTVCIGQLRLASSNIPHCTSTHQLPSHSRLLGIADFISLACLYSCPIFLRLLLQWPIVRCCWVALRLPVLQATTSVLLVAIQRLPGRSLNVRSNRFLLWRSL